MLLRDWILKLDKFKQEGIIFTSQCHVEKDVLTQLNIPSLNLETVGCPKYDVLKYQTPSQLLLPSCGFRADDSTHHCPVTECSAFWHWYKSGN